MRNNLTVCALAAALASILSINASGTNFPDSKEFERVQMHGITLSLFQDEKGFVWAGTQNSLQRYNGESFEPYRFQVPESWHSSTSLGVNTSCCLEDGSYLLGTPNGIVRFDVAAGQVDNYPFLPGKDIRGICPLPDGSLLVASSSGPFICREGEERLIAPSLQQLCYQIVQHQRGMYWICSYGGLYSYDPTTSSIGQIILPSTCSDGALSAASDPVRNCLWVGTGDSLYRLDDGSTMVKPVSSFKGTTVKVLLLDSRGVLWAGTERGLMAYNPEDDTVRTYRHDAQDNKSISNNVIWSLMEDHDGNIWIGTNSGVSIIRSDGALKVYRWRDLFDGPDVNNIGCVFVDYDKSLWLGGDSGVGHFDGKSNPWYREESEKYHINKNMVRDIASDNNEHIWLATDDGVDIFDRNSGHFSNKLFSDAESSRFAHWCYGVSETVFGRIAVCSFESGVFEANIDQVTSSASHGVSADKTYSVQDGNLPDNAVKEITATEDGSLWVLMMKGGLVCINDGDTEVYRQLCGKEILPQSILVTDDGAIWLSSMGGLLKFTPSTKESDFVSLGVSETWPLFEKDSTLWAMSSEKVYSIKDGVIRTFILDSSDYTCGAEYDDGTIIVAGGEKVALLSWTQIEDGQEPQLYFTGARLNGEALEIGRRYENGRVILDRDLDDVSSLSLPWERRNLELDVYSPSEIPIEYGVSADAEEWSSLGKSPLTLYLPGLSPGEHRIVFRNSSDGKEIRSFTVIILSPWYARWYMILLYSLIAIVIIALVSTLIVTRGHLKIETAQKEFYLRQAKENESQLETLRKLSGATEPKDTPDTILVRNLSAYIQKHIDDSDISVQKLADEMKLPAKQLYRKVKAATGLTVVEFVRGLRLQKAAELLRSGKYNVSETMTQVGFSNLSYFTRCFMELYGVSPKKYMDN